MAAAEVAVTANRETTAVAMATPTADPVTAHATELPRTARARGRAGVTAKTIARAIAATWVAMARFTTAVAAAEVAVTAAPRDHGGRDGDTDSRPSDRARDGVAADRPRSRSRGRDGEDDRARDRRDLGRDGEVYHGRGSRRDGELRDRRRSSSHRDEGFHDGTLSESASVVAASSMSRGREVELEREERELRELHERLRECERVSERERERERQRDRDRDRDRDRERDRGARDRDRDRELRQDYDTSRPRRRGGRVGSDARDRRLSWSPRNDNDERDRSISPPRRR